MGVPLMAAHFFVFYFGIVADITPPVALAAYAGSAIAKADPMKTGLTPPVWPSRLYRPLHLRVQPHHALHRRVHGL